MPNETPQVVAHEPTPLEIAVRERTWDWLLELRRRLKIDLLLMDGRQSVVLPTAPGDRPAEVLSMLERGEANLTGGISSVLQERVARVLEIEGLQVACLPVRSASTISGALLISRSVPSRQRSVAARSQLELVGVWLSTAIEAHLQGPPSFPASGLNRIAPLAALLGRASEHESDRELIRLFGEAIAVWHDIEVCSYIETQSGSFVRDVMLPGARAGERPAMISAIGLPDSGDLTRLPQGHLDRFGHVNSDLFVKRFQNGERAWLLVFIGEITPFDLQRLEAYVALLELALGLSAAVTARRVSTAVANHLVDADGSIEGRVHRALEELRTIVGAASATVTFGDAAGTTVLRAVSPAGAQDSESSPSHFRVVLVKRSERHYTTTVSLGRHESLPFTPRDSSVAGSAAEAFGMWAPVALSAASGRRERRAAGRGFPEVLERSATEAMDRGSPVAVVVLVVRNGARRVGSTQQWVAGIRGMMRASDLAGMISESEIGLLMRDTEADQAKQVAERLRTVVEGTPGQESVLIGVAARYPDQGSAEGILHDARANAVAGRRRSSGSHSPHGVNH